MKLFFAAFLFTTTIWAANETFQAALEKLYPDCELKKEVLYLTKDQKARIDKLSGLKLHSRLANRYKTCDGGYVYIDSHIVRTLNQTVVVEVKGERVQTYNVTAFLEPQEYKAPLKWLKQLAEKKLGELTLFDKIDGLSGATLTAKANVDAAKRVLAIDHILSEAKAKKQKQ